MQTYVCLYIHVHNIFKVNACMYHMYVCMYVCVWVEKMQRLKPEEYDMALQGSKCACVCVYVCMYVCVHVKMQRLEKHNIGFQGCPLCMCELHNTR